MLSAVPTEWTTGLADENLRYVRLKPALRLGLSRGKRWAAGSGREKRQDVLLFLIPFADGPGEERHLEILEVGKIQCPFDLVF